MISQIKAAIIEAHPDDMIEIIRFVMWVRLKGRMKKHFKDFIQPCVDCLEIYYWVK
jgi:hypothetical protein